ncbi:microcin C transport system substrate-binding protein [Palleronia marisminoris]|uniref:Bacterial extracellular solute-binding proteins, family 5 Middle n=1 Tax=Palleronia marisminoris TaxID=315423 RepID=A0A1Y5SGW0_9RHOB|nr:extracellular solute-binding protein [Palleronia marisminoris]SFG82064.1 microcin C transport system substrate-binding protein [Palleronia marisminoris]SLN40415.1 Bacterial extracellular solute-binding proteins, family 5 Middle [Palleronia marisminoris]
MPSRRPQSAIAIARAESSAQRLAMQALLTGAAIVALATAAFAQEAEDVTTSHGYTNFGELKYGPGEVLDYVNPDAPKGGTFSTWSLGNFDSFNLYTRAGVPAALADIGTERLMTETLDDPYGSYCFLCETVEYDEDRTYATFHLRDDVTFQNGEPMTAEDVKFTHELFVEQGITEYRTSAAQFYDSIEVIDDHTVRFNFSDFMPKNVRVQQAGGSPVFSKDWFEETGTRLDESATEPFMTTGPYVLDGVEYNRQVVYAKDPDYWGADLPLNQGRNNFDSIRIEYFADTSAALEAFKAGEYLYRAETDPADWNTAYEFRALSNGYVTREEIETGSVGERFSWVFNLDKEKWQDRRVREAIGMMFNFAWSNDTLYYGAYRQPVSFWNNTDLAAEGPPSAEEIAILQPLVDEGLLDPEILTEPAAVPVEHDATTNRPNRRIIRAAGALLEAAGWETGEDGVRRKDGEPLTLTFIQFNPQYDKVIAPFLSNLELIGVQGNLERVDTAQYVQRRREGNFDLTNQIFRFGFEPSTGLEQWFGSEDAADSSRNIMRLRSDAVDRLIEVVTTEADTLEDLTAATHALDRTLRRISFDIPFQYNPETWVAYYNVYQHPEDLPPLGVGAIDFWWWDDEAEEELRAAGAF